MSPDTQTVKKQARRVARHEPAAGVVAIGPGAARFAGLLERDGLSTVVSSARSGPKSARGLLVAAATPADAKLTAGPFRERHPEARLVLVVDGATPAEARQLLVGDVSGLVLEGQAETALAPTVRAAMAGQIAYPAELMPNQLRRALTRREKQILGMVVLGFSNAEIAAKLFVSESTVKSHLSSAFATIGVRTRKEAAALILDPDAGFGTGILAITDPG